MNTLRSIHETNQGGQGQANVVQCSTMYYNVVQCSTSTGMLGMMFSGVLHGNTQIQWGVVHSGMNTLRSLHETNQGG